MACAVRTRLYHDSITASGAVDPKIYSYNQGTPVGADVLRYRITGEQRYLDRAEETATAALRYLGTDDRLWEQAPSFNAIWFRNLLQLDQVRPRAEYRRSLDAYLARAWTGGRDARTGVYGQAGMGSYGDRAKDGTNLLDQAAFVQLHALSAWPRADLDMVG